MNTRDIKLDLSKEFIPSQMVIIGQGDSGGTTIRATILDNSVPVTLTGATAHFKMRLPKGKDFYEGSCTVSGSTVTHVVDESHAASVFGYTDEAYFEITLDGHTYSTSRFRVKIERAATDGATPSGSWTDVVTEFIEDAQEQLDDYEAEKSAEIGRATTTMVDTVNQAASNANQAATNANDAATSAEDRIEAAIEAAGEISELAVPLMSSDIRGGAKLGDGLEVEDGKLRVAWFYYDEDGDLCQA